jgi:hypothetical protein
MARGRKVNWDAKVKSLVAELRTALVERERTRLETRVNEMVAGIGHGLESAKRKVSATAAKVARAAQGKRGVYKRTAAQRKAQAAKMRAYWAAKRKAKG